MDIGSYKPIETKKNQGAVRWYCFIKKQSGMLVNKETSHVDLYFSWSGYAQNDAISFSLNVF